MLDHNLDQYLNRLDKKKQIVVNYLRSLTLNTLAEAKEVYKEDGVIFL